MTISSIFSKDILFLLVGFGWKKNGQSSDDPDDEKDQPHRDYFKGSHLMLINTDHDLSQDEDQGAIDDKGESEAMKLKIVQNASKKLDDDEYGQNIGDEVMEP